MSRFVIVVCLAIAVTVPPASAEDSISAAKPHVHSEQHSKTESRRIVDVELAKDRTLNGLLVDGNGKVVVDSMLELRQGRLLSTARSDSMGRFQFERVRGGIYELSGQRSSQILRVWSRGTAPKNACGSVVLVAEAPVSVIRGQSPLSLKSVSTNALARAGLLMGATVGVSAIIVNQVGDESAAPVQNQVAFRGSPAEGDPVSPPGDDIVIIIDHGPLSPN